MKKTITAGIAALALALGACSGGAEAGHAPSTASPTPGTTSPTKMADAVATGTSTPPTTEESFTPQGSEEEWVDGFGYFHIFQRSGSDLYYMCDTRGAESPYSHRFPNNGCTDEMTWDEVFAELDAAISESSGVDLDPQPAPQ